MEVKQQARQNSLEHNQAIACLIMVTQALNIPASLEILQQKKISETANVDIVPKAAKALGLKASEQKITPEIFGKLSTPFMAIMKDGQYVVVGPNDQRRILFFVPGQKPTAMTFADFVQLWSGSVVQVMPRFTWRNLLIKYNITWFTNVLLHYKKFIYEVLMASFFLQLFGLLTPLFTQVLIDKVIGSHGLATLDVLAGLLVVLYVFQAGLSILRTYVLTHTTNKFDVILGTRLFRQLIVLPLQYFEHRRVGDTVMRVGALNTIRDFLTGTALTLGLDTLFAIVFLAIMFYYSVPLTLLALVALPVFILQNLYVTPIYKQRLEASWESGAENNAFMVETITGMQTVKSLAVEPQFVHKWEELLAKYVRRTFDTATLGIGVSGVSGVIQSLSGFSILWLGGHIVMEGGMTLGQLIAFQMLAAQAMSPIMNLVGMWQTVQQAGLSMERLGDIINTRPEPSLRGARATKPLQGGIILDNVTFRYRPDYDAVLQKVFLEIKPGSRVGIVGRSGSGKSTLTKLIQKLYSIESGNIFVDGVDIAEIDSSILRQQIGVVMQENYLFNGSVRENIALARPSVAMEEVIRAAKIAGAHDFILELPEGYDTKVGERGTALSGGQRQRVAIARSLLTDPRLLIFDEATSALDYESERVILDNLDTICLGRTVLMIAHRLSTVRSCDMIVVVDSGRIVETGTHEELMIQGGLYKNLYLQQEG